MRKNNIKSKEGFTIIEVVLVLAIAGLIFLMVFVAFPALQRNQKDARRTQDIGRVQSSLINWQNNHNNRLPEPSNGAMSIEWTATENFNDENACQNAACQFVRDYLNSAAVGSDNVLNNTFEDPDRELYNFVITANVSGSSKNDITNLNTVSYNDYSELVVESSPSDGDLQSVTIGGEKPFEQYAIYIIPGATCDQDHAISANKNDFAILYRMEGAGVKCTGSSD